MGVDSGLADFRGDTGLWTMAKENFLKYSTARAFDDDPVIAWNFYIDRIRQYGEVAPHRGFTGLLDLLKSTHKPYFVVTSNVDGHFQKAGYNPALVHEMHGDLRHAQCKNVCSRRLYPMPRFQSRLASAEDLPKCTNCDSILRPHVMMFSDPWFLWQNVDMGAERYARWSANKLNILGIEIGAGTTVPSIRYFAEERTTALIRINPYESEVNRDQDVAIAATALDGINTVLSAISAGVA